MASKGSLRKSLWSVGRKRKRETGRTERDRYERWTEKERTEIEMTEGTARVEKIFANTRGDPSGTRRRGREKDGGRWRKHAH